VASPDDAVALLESLLAVGAATEGRSDDALVRIALSSGDDAELTVVRAAGATGAAGEVVVADRIVASERARLDEMGVGWLDRRGHLKLQHGNTWLDIDVPPVLPARARHVVDPLAGAVVSAVSLAALLAHPEPMVGVRALAREVGASPGGVSLAVRRLVGAGLLTRDRRAAVPGLFWAVVDGWRPDWVPLVSVPSAGADTVVVGDRAAAALGAPVGGSDGTVELLAADPATVRRLSRTYSVASMPSAAVARLALAPSPVAMTISVKGTQVDGHAIAHPVVVALTLAGDTARGAEIVRDWDLDDRPW
jgi:DNA-binding IclR family transcriptional regulator